MNTNVPNILATTYLTYELQPTLLLIFNLS